MIYVYTHTLRTTRQEQSKKSRQRNLLRNCRAVLDIFQSVDTHARARATAKQSHNAGFEC